MPAYNRPLAKGLMLLSGDPHEADEAVRPKAKRARLHAVFAEWIERRIGARDEVARGQHQCVNGERLLDLRHGESLGLFLDDGRESLLPV